MWNCFTEYPIHSWCQFYAGSWSHCSIKPEIKAFKFNFLNEVSHYSKWTVQWKLSWVRSSTNWYMLLHCLTAGYSLENLKGHHHLHSKKNSFNGFRQQMCLISINGARCKEKVIHIIELVSIETVGYCQPWFIMEIGPCCWLIVEIGILLLIHLICSGDT